MNNKYKDTFNKRILCATLGQDVHVAGCFNFIRMAEQQGYKVTFLRPPNTTEEIIKEALRIDPEIIALSYRLTPEVAIEIVKKIKKSMPPELTNKKWIFGGTTPVCQAVKKLNFFSYIFDGSKTDIDLINFFGIKTGLIGKDETYPTNLIDRIYWSKPFPILRAHFGLPSLEETIDGIKKIATAKVLDVISIGPDQNFQENYFYPEQMIDDQRGAGGVPIRSEEDLRRLYEASRRGNYPLLRCYSGTRSLINMAELLKNTINNAWGATPLFWYSELDSRSNRKLENAISENISVMKWHGRNNIPFECNESHHWSLRSAPDAIAVTAAFLGAYNAKKAGIKNYISQLMFDTPLGISPKFDLAKMLAKTELIESLHDSSFTSYRQVRTGLFSFPEDFYLAKGQLASSIQIAMFIQPSIVHVVSYCEANHAAYPEDVIESAKICRKVISNSLRGLPSIYNDPDIVNYKQQLISDVRIILKAIVSIADENVNDPLTDPVTLAKAVKIGLLDAPHLTGLKCAQGKITTSIIDGKCQAIDPDSKKLIPEYQRINDILYSEGYPILTVS